MKKYITVPMEITTNPPIETIESKILYKSNNIIYFL